MTENNENNEKNILNDDDFWQDMGVNKVETKQPLVSTSNPDIQNSENNTVNVEVKEAPTHDAIVFCTGNLGRDDIPILSSGIAIPPEYRTIVDRILVQYENLPKLEYAKLYKEISDLSIKACPTPSLQVLNQEFEKIQAAKDRLSEIFVEVIKCHTFKKRAVDILKDTWGRFSQAKSADSRKSEACYIVSDFEKEYALTESLYKVCDHVFKILDGSHDTLSRKVTIIQTTLKMHDMGRGALPDFDFKRFNVNIDQKQLEQVDPTQSIEATEKDF